MTALNPYGYFIGYPDSTNAVGDNQRRYKQQGGKKKKRVSIRFSLFGRQWPKLIFSVFMS